LYNRSPAYFNTPFFSGAEDNTVQWGALAWNETLEQGTDLEARVHTADRYRVTDEDNTVPYVARDNLVGYWRLDGPTLLDDFEDSDIAEYSGNTSFFSTSDAETYQGDRALLFESSSGNQIMADTDVSFAQGERVEFYVSLDNDIAFEFGVQDEVGWSDAYSAYELEIAPSQLIFWESNNGSWTGDEESASGASFPTDEWLRVQLDWHTNDTMIARVYATNGTLLESLSRTDSTFDRGGIGWNALDSNGATYADHLTKRPLDYTVTDHSGTGNDGTVSGGPAPAVDGFDDGSAAFAFDGDGGHLNVSDDASLDGMEEITFSAWINPRSFGENMRFLRKNVAYTMRIGPSGNVYYDVNGDDWTWHDSGYTTSAGHWNHLLLMYNGTHQVLYVNGEQQDTTAETGDIVDNNAPVQLATASHPVNGTMDEVRIWNTSLTAEDVRTLVNPDAYSWDQSYRDWEYGMEAYWDFEQTSGAVVDQTGNGYDGTVNGDINRTADGYDGANAYRFDGADDDVTVPDMGFSGDTSVSVSSWIQIDGDAGTSNNIFGFGNAGNAGEVYAIRTRGDGGFRFYFWSDDLDVDGPNYYGEWVHVTAVYDATDSRRKVYLNGELIGADTPANPNFQDQSYLIGGFNGEHFDGTIDDMRVYSRDLSNDTIKDLADQGTDWAGGQWRDGTLYPDTGNGLVGYWPLESTSGNVTDWSGNGNDGIAASAVDRTAEGFVPQSNAYRFEEMVGEGVNDMGINVSDVYEASNGVTLSAWVYADGWGNQSEGWSREEIIIQSDTNGMITLRGDDRDEWGAGRAILHWRDSNDDYYAYETRPLRDKTWYHVAGVYDEDTTDFTLYLNGEEQTSFPSGSSDPSNSQSVVTGTSDWLIGRSSGGNHWDGKLDEVRVYNRTLSQTEIQDITSPMTYTSRWMHGPFNWVNWERIGGMDGDVEASVRKMAGVRDDPELLAAWSLEGHGQTVVDSSVNGFHGTMGRTNDVETADPARVHGYSGRGMHFDSENGEHVNTSLYPDKDTRALAYWVKFDSFTTAGNDHQVIGANDNMNRAFYLGTHNTGSDVAGGWGDVDHAESSATMAVDRWHHLAMTSNGSKAWMYLDGEQVNTFTYSWNTTDTDQSSDAFHFGAKTWEGSVNYNMDATLDEIYLYDRNLSAVAIQRLANVTDFAPAVTDGEGGVFDVDESFDGYYQFKLDTPSIGFDDAAMKGAWRFEGGGDTVDDLSGNGHTGTVNGDPARVTGYAGQGMRFDGGDYVETSYYPEGPAHSVAYWVKFDGETNIGSDRQVLGTDDTNRRLYLGRYDDASGSVYSGLGDTTQNVDALDIGQWYHLAMTGDGDTARVYVDGEQVNSFDYTWNTTQTDQTNDPFHLGAKTFGGSVNYYINGTVDEVYALDRGLSTADVRELMNSAPTGDGPYPPRVESVSMANASGWTRWMGNSTRSTAIDADTMADSLMGYWPLEERELAVPTPVGIAEVQTNNGAHELVSEQARNVDNTGLDVRSCEMDVGDGCDAHADEEIGWFVTESGDVTVDGTTIGQAGTFTTSDGDWQVVDFNQAYAEPVVVGTSNTKNGGQNALIFEANVSSASAHVRLCETEGNETDGCDAHTAETGGYLIIDAAEVSDVDGLEAGTFEQGGGSDDGLDRTTVSYDETFAHAPIVLGSVQTVNGSSPTEVRVTHRRGNEFVAGICHQDGIDVCDSDHVPESVGWVAIEPGNVPFDQPSAAGATGDIAPGGGTWLPVGYQPVVDAADPSTSTADILGYGIGDVTVGEPGVFDASAYRFDGTTEGYLVVPDRSDNARLDATDALTMAAWVKLDNATASDDHYVISKSNFGADGYGFNIRDTGRVEADVNTVDSQFHWDTDTNISTEDWAHVAVTYNGSQITLYINGTQRDSLSRTGDIRINTNDVMLGTASGNPGVGANMLDGWLNEPRIYNRSLSADEISQLYQYPPGAPFDPGREHGQVQYRFTATAPENTSILNSIDTFCGPPESGDWIIREDCTFTGTDDLNGDVDMRQDATLTMDDDSWLQANLSSQSIDFEQGGENPVRRWGENLVVVKG